MFIIHIYNTFPWIAPLNLNLMMLSIEQRGIKYRFLAFGMTRPEIEPQPLGTTGEHSNHYAMDRL